MVKSPYKASSRTLLFGIIANLLFTIIEFFGGLFTNSLALMSDAIHDLSDTLSLLLAWFAGKKAQNGPTQIKTFGYHRATILAAFVNAAVLIAVTFAIFYRAYLRILNPEPVAAGFVLVIAVLGILFNGAVVLKFWSKKNTDLNMQSAFWHMLEDALGWIGVLVSAVVIIFTGWYIIDPIISIIIGVIVLKGSWHIISESTNILLEGFPSHLDFKAVISEIKKVKPVRDVHDLHVWSIGYRYLAVSCHVVVRDMKITMTYPILCAIEKRLRKKFGISHITVAFEAEGCRCRCN